LIKLLFVIVIFIVAIFLIEKISFPSPEKKYQIDVTDEIKKL
jgi:flagellar biogenesis protein FliO